MSVRIETFNTGGFILISKSAFLFPKEDDNCSCVKPSASADCFVVIVIDAKIDNKTMVAIMKAMVFTTEDDIAKTCRSEYCILIYYSDFQYNTSRYGCK